MAAVINLHALANYLNDPFVLKIWDFQQFAVQIFVFCSAYLFFSRPPEISLQMFSGYFVKRFWRLYKPFLLYLVLYFLAVFLIKPDTFSWKTVFLSATLIGGIDINWLVLLFVQFIPLFVIIHFLQQKHRFWFRAFIFLVVYTAIFLFFLPFPYHWRTIMWLTWSFMAFYAMYYKAFEDDENENYRTVSYMLFATIFVMIVCIEALLHERLTIYPNKYPPNILILSYGIIWIGIFDFLHRQGIFTELRLIRPLSFLSKYSYSLFFIHYLVIYIMNGAFNLHRILPWWGYPLVLFPVSIGIQLGINKIYELRKKDK